MGTVTSVNEELLNFTVCENLLYNAGIYLVKNCLLNLTLPNVGDEIAPLDYEIHVHREKIRNVSVLTVCAQDKQIITFSRSISPNHYSWMIKQYDLGKEDVFTMTDMYESVKDTVLPEMDAVKIILLCCENKLDQRPRVRGFFDPNDCCDNQYIPRLKCITISHCKSIKVDGHDYSQFPYWSYGCHWIPEGQVLIGYLFVHPDLGTICIKDKLRTIGCIIMRNDDNQDYSDLIDKTVYIDKYFILTEMFNPNPKFNLAYICMDFKDIHPSVTDKRKREQEETKRFTMKFLILSKSYPNYTQAKGIHFWLHVEEIETNYLKTMHNLKEKSRCFLCFSRKFMEKLPNLEVFNIHSIYFDNKLQTTRDVEYSRINPGLLQLSIRDEVVLSEKQDKQQEEPLVLLDESSIEQILQSTGLVSFVATLKVRKFCPPNDSRTSQSKVPPGFGLLGVQTHILDFCIGESRTLSLYLNNWERLAMPIGLIPSVVVKVRNVYIQNKKYCKSSPLTTLEMIEYRPEITFSSANLFDDSDWGPVIPLGHIEKVPDRILIHTRASGFEIIKLSARRECKKCSCLCPGSRKVCGESGCDGPVGISFTFSFQLEEGSSKARVISKDVDILAAFMGLEDELSMTKWKAKLEQVGLYYYQRSAHFAIPYSNTHLAFLKTTSYRLRKNERKMSQKISIVCRKMSNDRHFNKDETLWFGLKAKLVPES